MPQQFVDREFELKSLEEEYRKPRAGFAIVYGRRRVGKTEILLQFLKGKEGIYFLADRRGYKENIREFQKVAAPIVKDPMFERVEFESWYDMFTHLSVLLDKSRKIVIVIDEYPYLIEEGVNEEFQKIWDMILSKMNVLLVLVGSSVSMMEKAVLFYGAPLYGRRTMQLHVRKLPFIEIKNFFPRYKIEELIEAYSILDGIPLYLRQFSDEITIEENLKRNYFRKDAFLYEEAEFLLREEFREPRKYFSILEALAQGKRTFGEIVDTTKMDKSTVSKYVSVLENLHIIETDLPFGVKKSRLKRYKIADNYLLFWFRYVYPHRTLIEMNRSDILVDTVKETFDMYVSVVFEKVIKELLLHKQEWHDISSWWNRRGEEIDVVAVNKRRKEVLFAEVKWRNRKMGWTEYEELRRKSELVQGLEDYRKKYLLVNKGGFHDKDKLAEEGAELWDLRKIEEIIGRYWA